MVNLHVRRSVKLPVKRPVLIRAAQLTLDVENNSPNAEISVVIGDDKLLRNLNSKYRDTDAATDVLSFSSNETDPDTDVVYLGDVVISLPRAEEQALEVRHSLEDELQLLVVHGTLHLLGYDHMKPEDKKLMQGIQNNILTMLGIRLLNTL